MHAFLLGEGRARPAHLAPDPAAATAAPRITRAAALPSRAWKGHQQAQEALRTPTCAHLIVTGSSQAQDRLIEA